MFIIDRTITEIPRILSAAVPEGDCTGSKNFSSVLYIYVLYSGVNYFFYLLGVVSCLLEFLPGPI